MEGVIRLELDRIWLRRMLRVSKAFLCMGTLESRTLVSIGKKKKSMLDYSLMIKIIKRQKL